jgi:hypothetical protein
MWILSGQTITFWHLQTVTVLNFNILKNTMMSNTLSTKDRISACICWLESRPQIPAHIEIEGAWIESEIYLRYHINAINGTVISDRSACHQHLDAVEAVAGAIKAKGE